MSYGDPEAFRSDNERECREHGKVYVRGHHTRDGDWVRGYCRDRTKGEIKRMSPHERKLFEKQSPNLKGYYETSGNDPLDAISEILRTMDLPYDGGGEIEYELPNGDTTRSEEEVKRAGSATFMTTVYKNGRYYNLGGNVSRKKTGSGWEAGAEAEEVDF